MYNCGRKIQPYMTTQKILLFDCLFYFLHYVSYLVNLFLKKTIVVWINYQFFCCGIAYFGIASYCYFLWNSSLFIEVDFFYQLIGVDFNCNRCFMFGFVLTRIDNNHSCVIFNVDGSWMGSPTRAGNGGFKK